MSERKELARELGEMKEAIEDLRKARHARTEAEKAVGESKDEESKLTESGYSEAQQALDIEMRSGDLSALKKSKTFQALSGNIKRLVAYRTISIRLKDMLILYVDLLPGNPHRAQKLLEELLILRKIHNYLFNKILGKEDETVDVKTVPEELREFVS